MGDHSGSVASSIDPESSFLPPSWEEPSNHPASHLPSRGASVNPAVHQPAFAPLEDVPTNGAVSPAVSGHLVTVGRSPTQFVQSLDQLEGFSAHLFGASAESDPWLLRHCSFDDAGVKCFYKVHFRNAGGVPTADKIPVHFMLAADDLATSAKQETSCRFSGDATREELNRLVPHDYGQRLVSLLWRMAYELISEEIHTPHLAVLQTALLYLHRPLDEARASIADTPFVWSFVGTIVGLAESLGLHIECRMWGIPAWEKRLRRRLWWAIYAEDKWRSLLMGRPPYIHRSEWDVSELDGADFLYHTRGASSSSSGVHQPQDPVPFRYLVDLSGIAEQIYESF
ncbi:unnamed protein product [Aspergillus oryzae]|uniref:Unnamed protein product n=2 Tax=Aspergillus oryzae TaxID=5062 RepID=A0AAN4YYI0_ASPOZ|nr:unnamed protein product [Aspergillus oryzae]GMF89659.1 unnamed protein product [Aspergillus oryzae]GMG08956.1 unnamed protein product [Aspergillus oryzae]GMG38267.1 unnamed protein product [Aspergillus oryzae]GMG50159.1 unnamed protein product [Aspergillus oryzae var. brunneus]